MAKWLQMGPVIPLPPFFPSSRHLSQCDFRAFSIQRGHVLHPLNLALSCDKTGQCRVAVCHDAKPRQAMLTTLNSSWSQAQAGANILEDIMA